MDEENITRKKISIVSGDGNIDISDVYNHLNIESPSSENSQKKNNIVIPPDSST